MGSSLARWAAAASRALVANRHRSPAWMSSAINRAIAHPNSLLGRLAYRLVGADDGVVGDNPPVQAFGTRLYIGPANYAGQGYLWAHALTQRRTDAQAVNMVVEVPGGMAFPADITVPLRTYMGSRAWQSEQFDYVAQFTHCLVESGRPLFGESFGPDAFAEVEALETAGVSVAMMCHGSDVRLPSRHRDAERWSPFLERAMFTRAAEIRAADFRRKLDEFRGPVFVSTPDLLADVPYATWCPVVVDPSRWTGGARPMQRDRPLVVHAPSRSIIKGSELIEDSMRALEAAGVIEYRRIQGVASHDMPALYKNADIVLDQFRIANYGVAACEAMAAGRVVVSHVSQSVRAAAEEHAGVPLPIIEANPDTIGEVVRGLVLDPSDALSHADRGQDFVQKLHDGRASADALASAWLGSRPSTAPDAATTREGGLGSTRD